MTAPGDSLFDIQLFAFLMTLFMLSLFWVFLQRYGARQPHPNGSVCEDCRRDIDWNEDGGHILYDGSVLCPQCENL